MPEQKIAYSLPNCGGKKLLENNLRTEELGWYGYVGFSGYDQPGEEASVSRPSAIAVPMSIQIKLKSRVYRGPSS